jgi:hypothetical protein
MSTYAQTLVSLRNQIETIRDELTETQNKLLELNDTLIELILTGGEGTAQLESEVVLQPITSGLTREDIKNMTREQLIARNKEAAARQGARVQAGSNWTSDPNLFDESGEHPGLPKGHDPDLLEALASINIPEIRNILMVASAQNMAMYRPQIIQSLKTLLEKPNEVEETKEASTEAKEEGTQA